MSSPLTSSIRGKPGLACLAGAAIVDFSTEGERKLLAPMADWLGYEWSESIQDVPEEKNSAEQAVSQPTAENDPELGRQKKTKKGQGYLPFPFWCLSRIVRHTLPKQPDRPDWLDIVPEPVTEPAPADTESVNSVPASPAQLVSMSRFWPMLINDLSSLHRSRQPDLKRIIQAVASVRPMPCRARLQQQKWSDYIQILVDTGSGLTPFRSDFMRFVEQLSSRTGTMRVQVLRFIDRPGGLCQGWYWDQTPDQEYRVPGQHGRVLILGDLGILSGQKEDIEAWNEFVVDLKRQGQTVYLFTPAQPCHYSADLNRKETKIQPWNPAARFPRHIGAVDHAPLPASSSEQLEQLKILLSCTTLFHPALLRRFRTTFIPQAPPELEIRIWQLTEDYIFHGSLAAWQPGRLQKYREQFRKMNADRQKEILAHRDEFFTGFPFDFQTVQEIVADSCLGRRTDAPQQFLQAMLARSFATSGGKQGLDREFFKFLLANQDTTDWQQDKSLLHTAFVVVHQQELRNNEYAAPFPQGFDPSKINWFQRQEQAGRLSIREREGRLRCAYQPGQEEEQPGTVCFNASYPTAHPPLWKNPNSGWQLLGNSQDFMREQQSVQINTGEQIIEIAALERPIWADSIGRDRYGLYGDLVFKGVVQRFRWCPPGTFMMGSPEDEPERYDDETLHQVTLSQGFWLADTAVTQAFWQVVMGDNPSVFYGHDRPVEQVSWHDAEKFIQKLNALVPGLAVRLPTEKQWEYGCRAGTTTPFSFGDFISQDLINYDGSRPYNNDTKGRDSDKTVAVKSLPCNKWGMYEMHGNVWEWCHDWSPVNLDMEPMNDPPESKTGEFRMLRGGSWVHDGRSVRSAFRIWSDPGNHDGDFGFRLSQGHGLR